MHTKISHLAENDHQQGRYEIERGQPLLFDLDGVLVDSGGLHDSAFLAAYREKTNRGIPFPLPWEEAAKTAHKLDALGVESQLLRDEIKQRKDELFQASLGHIRHDRRIAEMLSNLTNEISVVTSCSTAFVSKIMHAAGLLSRIKWKAIVSPKTNGEMKQETYRRALFMLRYDPREILAFEDSATGLEAARQCGILKAREMTFQRLSEGAGRAAQHRNTVL